MAATRETKVRDGDGFTVGEAVGKQIPVGGTAQRSSTVRRGSARLLAPSTRRRLEREATERGLRALDEMQRRFQEAGITDEDVERSIREVRGQV